MMPLIDMTNFIPDSGLFTVRCRSPKEKELGKNAYWECVCICGEIKHIQGARIRNGEFNGCGKCYLTKDKGAIDMNARVLNRKYESLSHIEKKVFISVPSDKSLSTLLIVRELQNKHTSMDSRTASGILNHLATLKLVQEGPMGQWKRISLNEAKAVEKDQPKNVEPIMETKTAIEQKPATRTPVEIIDNLMSELKAVMDKAESAALEIEQYIAGVEVRAKKMDQLKSLLQGLE